MIVLDMSKNTILISIVSFLVIIGFLGIVYKTSGAGEGAIDGQVIQSAKTVRPSDHIQWSPEKKVILTEYSDQQCPACAAFHQELKGWEDARHPNHDIVKNVTLVYRHYPLFTIHKNSRAASYAVEAAGKQGKFFEYSDILFTKQPEWSELSNPKDMFLNYAKSIKLDTAQFEADMKSDAVVKTVQDDVALGNEGDVQGTPSFFLNGQKMQISTIDDFAKQLRASFKSK
jgi:protein-disulfide isomerase